MSNRERFTALDLDVRTRNRRQFMRGLVRTGRAVRATDKDGRKLYRAQDRKPKRNRSGKVGVPAPSVQLWAIYEWV